MWRHGRQFEIKIIELAMPLRLALMVPISNGRIQVFEEQIIELIDHFIELGYTTQNQEQLQFDQIRDFWESKSPHEFDYKANQIALEILSKTGNKLSLENPLEPG